MSRAFDFQLRPSLAHRALHVVVDAYVYASGAIKSDPKACEEVVLCIGSRNCNILAELTPAEARELANHLNACATVAEQHARSRLQAEAKAAEVPA